MRGQIIDIVDKYIILCIGSKNGAQVGDEFPVYVIAKATPGFTRHYRKVQTGTVKITEIIDNHYFKGAIIHGTADMHSIVELPIYSQGASKITLDLYLKKASLLIHSPAVKSGKKRNSCALRQIQIFILKRILKPLPM
jgi:hypothetical protein